MGRCRRGKVTFLSGIIRSIIPPAEHNLEHNTLFSRVTPRSTILDFKSIIRQTLDYRLPFFMPLSILIPPITTIIDTYR